MAEQNLDKILTERGIQTDRYRMLVEHGRRLGRLNRDDVIDLIPSVEFDEPFIQQMAEVLSGEGVSFESIVEEQAPSITFPSEVEEFDELAELEREAVTDINLSGLEVDDVLRIYLREATQTPLLTAAEEVDLAKRIERCRRAYEELTKNQVSGERRTELNRIIEDGELARDRLIRANARLVVSVARRYVGHGLPLSDLIQEGNIGLMRSIRHYDYQRGFKFSTYATWWIRQAVTRALADQGRTIRLPAYMSDQVGRLRRVQLDLNQRLGRQPTTEELAEAMGLSNEKVEQMVQSMAQPVSLEAPVSEDDEAELGDMLEDVNALNPEETVMDSMMGEEVRARLDGLPPREKQVLELRYGLGDEDPLTLAEVGQRLGITRERARQLEMQAIERLRNPSARRRRRASQS